MGHFIPQWCQAWLSLDEVSFLHGVGLPSLAQDRRVDAELLAGTARTVTRSSYQYHI